MNGTMDLKKKVCHGMLSTILLSFGNTYQKNAKLRKEFLVIIHLNLLGKMISTLSTIAGGRKATDGLSIKILQYSWITKFMLKTVS